MPVSVPIAVEISATKMAARRLTLSALRSSLLVQAAENH